MPESVQVETAPTIEVIESPPPAAMPARESDPTADARTRLHQLAHELIKTHNRRLLVEYLQLRRALR